MQIESTVVCFGSWSLFANDFWSNKQIIRAQTSDRDTTINKWIRHGDERLKETLRWSAERANKFIESETKIDDYQSHYDE